MKRALELSLAISLALGVSNVWAVGLGQIQVKSRLNQPLVAEIPVTVDRGSDAETLSVSLASAEEFARIGIERSQIGVPLKFVISKNAGGQTVIRVTSTEPVRAPFLDFLIAANWNNGRVLREYTVLLDPPTMAPAVAAMPAPVAVPSRPANASPPPPPPRQVAAVPSQAADAEPAPLAPKIAAEEATTPPPVKPVVAAVAPMPEPLTEPESQVEPAPAAEASAKPVESSPVAVAPAPRALPTSKPLPPSVAASNGTNYGPVAAGETLWEIANATLPDDGVSANQLMLALLKANPQAFSRNNINRLKRGAILRIPSAEDIRAVGSMREATAQVRSQIADWRQQNSAPTLLAGTAAANVGYTEPSAESVSKAVDDRLALVPPEMGKDGLASTGQSGSSAGTSGGNATAAELARANESLASVKQEAGELKSRVQDLEDLKSKNDRLINLKNSEIADLQRKLAAVQSSSTPATAGALPAEVIAADADTTVKTDPVVDSPAEAKADIWGGTPAESAAAGETLAGAAPNPSNDSTVPPVSSLEGAPASDIGDTSAATTAPVAEAVAETSAATDNPLDGVATDVAAPVVGEQNEPAAESPWYLDPRILGGAGIIILLLGILAMRGRRKSGVVDGRPSIADKFGGDIAAAGALAQSADGVVMLDEEGQLVEQIAEQPDDLGARLELLSIYYADNRVDEFRAGALEMEPYVDDPTEAEWVQVRAMGEDLMPHDPLFSSTIAADVIDGESDEATEWSPDEESAPNPDLRWSDDGDEEGDILGTEDESVVTPVVVASDDISRYAPVAVVAAPIIAEPEDAGEFAGFDEYVAPEAVVPKAAEVHEDSDLDLGLDFDLDDDKELENPAPSAIVSESNERVDLTKAQTLTESSAVAKANDDPFEFDLPPLDFDSEFSKPEIIEPSIISDSEVGEDLDEEFLIGEDALGTKIDLARAYADMGDPDGARGMLEEVISEGDAEQQEQARKLLEELR